MKREQALKIPPFMKNTVDKEFQQGLFFSLAAFGFWALIQPYFFGAFEESSALIVMAHRTLWSCVFIWIWLALRNKISSALTLFRNIKLIMVMAVTGLMITTNWGNLHICRPKWTLARRLCGYFMTPLMTVAFGIVILGERPSTLQFLALAFGLLGVVFYTMTIGQVPVIALMLSLTFSAMVVYEN